MIYSSSLPEGQIRLIAILPCDDPEEPLKCELSQFSMDGAPPYEAISYVWGDPNIQTEIICNYQSISVTLNLRDALVRLRRRDAIRTLWADALCINQGDIIERNRQIPLMADVYSGAQRVAIWLGKPRPSDYVVTASFFHRVARACRKHSIGVQPGRILRYINVQVDVSHVSSNALRTAQEILSSPWFERIWCVQEAKLNDNATVFWGEPEIPWSEVGLTACWLFDYDSTKAMPILPEENFHGNAADMYRTLMPGFLDLLQDFKRFKASDPRDKVYGLMSLNWSSPEVQALTVSYGKMVAEVYVDTALAVIRGSGKLDALAYVYHPPNYSGADGYFSWAPRWDVLESPTPWRNTIRRRFSAASRIQAAMIQQNSEYTYGLRTIGLLFDHIQAVYPSPHSLQLGESHPISALWKHVVGDECIETSEAIQSVKKLARTLTIGFYTDQSNEGAFTFAASDEEEKWHTANFLAYVEDLSHEFPEQSLVAIEPLKLRIGNGKANNYRYVSNRLCGSRPLLVTENGSYGVGTASMRPGDIIVVLFGCDMPCVLRPFNNNYLFLGLAYVDEIMQGELINEMVRGERAVEEFCLA